MLVLDQFAMLSYVSFCLGGFFCSGNSAIHQDIGIRKIVFLIGCTVMWFEGQLLQRAGLYVSTNARQGEAIPVQWMVWE